MFHKVFIISLVMGFCLMGCDKKDQCLDGGKSYNAITQQCEK